MRHRAVDRDLSRIRRHRQHASRLQSSGASTRCQWSSLRAGEDASTARSASCAWVSATLIRPSSQLSASSSRRSQADRGHCAAAGHSGQDVGRQFGFVEVDPASNGFHYTRGAVGGNPCLPGRMHPVRRVTPGNSGVERSVGHPRTTCSTFQEFRQRAAFVRRGQPVRASGVSVVDGLQPTPAADPGRGRLSSGQWWPGCRRLRRGCAGAGSPGGNRVGLFNPVGDVLRVHSTLPRAIAIGRWQPRDLRAADQAERIANTSRLASASHTGDQRPTTASPPPQRAQRQPGDQPVALLQKCSASGPVPSTCSLTSEPLQRRCARPARGAGAGSTAVDAGADNPPPSARSGRQRTFMGGAVSMPCASPETMPGKSPTRSGERTSRVVQRGPLASDADQRDQTSRSFRRCGARAGARSSGRSIQRHPAARVALVAERQQLAVGMREPVPRASTSASVHRAPAQRGAAWPTAWRCATVARRRDASAGSRGLRRPAGALAANAGGLQQPRLAVGRVIGQAAVRSWRTSSGLRETSRQGAPRLRLRDQRVRPRLVRRPEPTNWPWPRRAAAAW